MAEAFSGSFVARKTLPMRRHAVVLGKRSHSRPPVSSMVMRDASASYWFQVGDSVRVVADDVEKAGFNLQNRVGRVVETWEKCDVDPTCCCAEQVDINMAVRVEFQGTEADETKAGTSFMHYFAEEELVKTEGEATANALPFDGMSCTAFKMDVLQSASQKPRGIASWEPVSPGELEDDK